MPLIPPQPAPPSPVPPSAAPVAGAGGNPLAGLANAGGSGGAMPAGLQAMMIFLAGMGLPVFESAMNKLRGGGAKGKTALGKEAAGNPQMTNSATAQMIARLAAMRQQGGAPGAAPAMPPAAAQLGGLIGR